ncbi:MAG TPA: hypothetical protein VG817_06015 [Gemmatimonadales bacterium]|nr:hypothetical protein [Gemmatimonadales bacterium]
MKPLSAVLVLATLLPGAAGAQATDAGVFQIRSASREIGTETFTVTGDTSVRITATTSYPGARPGIELTASLIRNEAGGAAFQLERKAGSTGGQVYAVQKRNRITIRRVDRGAEQASELPGGPRTLLLADSVFALYLQVIPLATESGQSLNAVFPHGARRVTLTAQRVPNGESGSLIRLTGGIEVEIELGNDDRVQRISLPALRLDAVRRAN